MQTRSDDGLHIEPDCVHPPIEWFLLNIHHARQLRNPSWHPIMFYFFRKCVHVYLDKTFQNSITSLNLIFII